MDMKENDEILYTPKQVAEKINVQPNMIGIYFAEFKEYLESFTVLTKNINGHKRYTEKALAIFFEIRRLLDQPGGTYQKVRDEFRRRKELELGGVAEVVQYEGLQHLEKLEGFDKEIARQIYKMAEAFNVLKEQNEKLIGRLTEQDNELFTLRQQVDRMGEVVSDHVAKEWATLSLAALEEKGKPGFFEKLFGLRNLDEENRLRERYKEVINRDRKEVSIVKPTKVENDSD